MKKEQTRREFFSTAKNTALGLGIIGIAPGMFLLKDARAAVPVWKPAPTLPRGRFQPSPKNRILIVLLRF